MFLLSEKCTLQSYDEEVLKNCNAFDCGHPDLNDFFKNDAIDYSYQLIGKSYCFTLDSNPETIVCAFTFSNDSIKLKNIPNARQKKIKKFIPHVKHLNSYPAVLIGRLGVNNGSDFLFSSDEQERNYYGVDKSEPLKTKFLFFDLITLSQHI